MSNAVALRNDDSSKEVISFTPDQLALIRNSIAKNATNEEFQLFIYRAKMMGLDPLKPGQIHFVKYGTSAGTVVIGIDGFRTFAHRTNKMGGIERGVKRDAKGKLTHGWCRIHRKDWTQPAYEEVPFVEYDTGRNNWAKMPETMIKKVAEAAALRMAFPSELGGIYAEEEMEKVALQPGPVSPAAYGQPEDVNDQGIYRFPIGYTVPDPKDAKETIQIKGFTMEHLHERAGTSAIEDMILRFQRILSGEEKTRMVMTDQRKADLAEFVDVAETFLKGLDGDPVFDSFTDTRV